MPKYQVNLVGLDRTIEVVSENSDAAIHDASKRLTEADRATVEWYDVVDQDAPEPEFVTIDALFTACTYYPMKFVNWICGQ
jgi:hypothetical protein